MPHLDGNIFSCLAHYCGTNYRTYLPVVMGTKDLNYVAFPPGIDTSCDFWHLCE